MWPLWSRIPERLPADLRRTLLDFLDVHPCIRLARTLQRLFHHTPRMSEFRRRTRWARHLDWADSSRLRRAWLICLTRQDYVHQDPRGPKTGDYYDMIGGCWRMYSTSGTEWSDTIRCWQEYATTNGLRNTGNGLRGYEE